MGNLALLFDPMNLVRTPGSPAFGLHYLFYPFIEKMHLNENLKSDMQVALYNTCNKVFDFFIKNPHEKIDDVYTIYLVVIEYISKGRIKTQRLPKQLKDIIMGFIVDLEDIVERMIIRLEEPMKHDKKEAEVRLIMREEAFVFINFMLLGFLLYMFCGFYLQRVHEIPFALFLRFVIDENMTDLYNMFRAQTQEHIVEAHIQLMGLIGSDIEKKLKAIKT